jgi:hypothetical protein
MKAKIDVLLSQCIEAGIASGIYRASKHTDAPDTSVIAACIEAAIWDQIYEHFEFEANEVF